jgi:hypothetical protein
MPNMKTVNRRNLNLLGGQVFLSQGPCDLDLWSQKGSFTNHDQSNYQIWRLWVKGILSYWADKLFKSRPLWLWPLTGWPQNQKGSSFNHDQSKYQIWRLCVIGILSYWADKEKPRDGSQGDGWKDKLFPVSSIPPLQLCCAGYNKHLLGLKSNQYRVTSICHFCKWRKMWRRLISGTRQNPSRVQFILVALRFPNFCREGKRFTANILLLRYRILCFKYLTKTSVIPTIYKTVK